MSTATAPHQVAQSTAAGRLRHLGRQTVDALTRPEPVAEPTLWWLGQAGFALRHPAGTVLVDPYLSDTLAAKYAGTYFPHRRLHPPPVAPEDLRGVDLVLHTHAHTDHLDPGTVRALEIGNRPRYVAPRARTAVALERGVPSERLVAVTAGDEVAVGDVRVSVVPAAHEELEVDEHGDHAFLGYVVEVAGVRVYHSGDCVPYDGQVDLIADLSVDVALLPVNGRDEERRSHGVPGNFTVDEAVRFCRDAGVPALLCHHFGLFDFNTVDPTSLVDRLSATAGALEWTVPAVGAAFAVGGVDR